MDVEHSRILVTGGAGFIGSHICLYLLERYPLATIVNFDRIDDCSSLYYFKDHLHPIENDQAVEIDGGQQKQALFEQQSLCQQEQSLSQQQPPIDMEKNNSISNPSQSLHRDQTCRSSVVQQNQRYIFVKGDILSKDLVNHVLNVHDIDIVLHFAAQSHVDNSFENSLDFGRDNIMGTLTLLECVRTYGKIKRFIHVSTDEVYGESAYDNLTFETSLLQPTNPYAASKAAAELMVQSYHKSFKMPLIIVRCNNVFGPHQFPEKLIPKFICRLEHNLKCCIHGKGETKRSFIYVKDVVRAYDLIMCHGVLGEIYNIEADEEYSVLEVTKKIIKLDLLARAQARGDTLPLFKSEEEEMSGIDNVFDKQVEYVRDRNFNDLRYAINGDKLKALGFVATYNFDQGLQETFDWYRHHDLNAIWTSLAVQKALRPHSN